MSDGALVYVTAVLNALRWRYSYGRKCFKTKLQAVDIDVPIVTDASGALGLDEEYISALLKDTRLDLRPEVSGERRRSQEGVQWVEKRLDDLFELQRGDFHSLKPLARGAFATVSRTSGDNGSCGLLRTS